MLVLSVIFGVMSVPQGLAWYFLLPLTLTHCMYVL